MRTGAIFARGSCRALKWMALLGVLFLLGGSEALAQVTGTAVIEAKDHDYSKKIVVVDLNTDVWGANVPASAFAGGTNNPADRITGLATSSPGGDKFTLAFVGDIDVGATITYTPPADDARELKMVDGADDGTDPDQVATFTLTVTEEENAPVLPAIAPITVKAGEETTVASPAAKLPAVTGGSGTGTITYAAVPASPFGLTIVTTAGDDFGKIHGTPTSIGTLQVTWTATDTATPTGTASRTFQLSVQGAPAKPDAPTVESAASRSLRVSWSAPMNNGSAITHYQVRYQGKGASSWLETATLDASAGTMTMLTELTNGTEYSVGVRALNGIGWSDYSDSGKGTPAMPAVTAPGMPTALAAEEGDRQVTLSWTAPSNTGGSAILRYEYMQDTGSWMTTGGTATTKVVTGLTNGTQYTFKVRAVNSTGPGPESAPAMATPMAQGPTTTTTTDADVKSISIEGEDERTIGGAKRLHLMEGDRKELSITLDWSVQQLRDIYAADSTPSPVTVHFEVREKHDGADWLSPIDLTGDDRDVLASTDAVSVKIPTKPRDSANANARVSSAPGKVRFAILEDDDAEDEAFTIAVLASESRGVSTRSTSGNKLMTGTYVIDDDETQGLKIKRTSKGTIYETGDDQEFEVSADPALVDLELDIRLDLTNADDSAVSRAYGVSPTSGTIGMGGKIEATVDVDNNDGNRMDDDLELHAEIVSRNRDDIEAASLEFTVLDVHKLPKLTVSPMEGMVDEGDEFELTLTLDRNPRDTRATDPETRQYTLEAVDVMLSGGAGTTAGMSDYRLPATVKFDKHSGKASDGWTQEMKVKVMALEDNDLDDGEMLVLDAMVSGTETKNGDDKMAYTGVSALTIGESTGKLVWARSPEEVEAAVTAAKKEGMGDDMMFTAGEMIELEGNDLFGSAEGVSVGYTAMVEGDAVSESVSGGVVTITADSMGMAKVTITARASRPSGAVMINDQTDPREASITIALEVGLVALSIELSGPEDMNIVEGGMGGMVTATANRAVTEATVVNLMRDRAMSSAEDADFTAEPITIMAGQMKGSTMVMAVEDNMMENDDNMAEELVLYGMAVDNAGEVTGHVKLYIWDAAVPALPVIAQLLLAAFLAVGGYRRYRRR